MSSGSDLEDIEIDGFPPESADSTRFTSLKSTTEVGQAQKIYLPISSWSIDRPPEEMIKNCVKVLREPHTISDAERQTLLDQLEGHLSNVQEILNTDSTWFSKSFSTLPRSPMKKPELSKIPSVKVNIEIPSASSNQNNIRYSIDQPVYDNDRSCWKTGMDFIFKNTNPTILETECEVAVENKYTQTDDDLASLRESFVLLQKPIGYDTRSRTEEKLIFPEVINLDLLSSRLSSDNEFTFLEKFEENLQDFNSGGRLSNFRTSFRKYKDVIHKSLHKHVIDIKKLKTECESVINLSYDRLTESQFKRQAQNQLLLIDVEQEVNFLNADINRKDLNFEKIVKFQSSASDTKQLEEEMKKIRFVNSLRLISQMLANLKTHITALAAELKNPQQPKSIMKINL